MDIKQAAFSWLQTFDTDFFYTGIKSFGATLGQTLKFNSDFVDVWCVPSATHVQCKNRSQIKVLGISVFVILFF